MHTVDITTIRTYIIIILHFNYNRELFAQIDVQHKESGNSFQRVNSGPYR